MDRIDSRSHSVSATGATCEGAMRRAIAPLGPTSGYPPYPQVGPGAVLKGLGAGEGPASPGGALVFLTAISHVEGHLQSETGHPFHSKSTIVR